MLRGVVIYGELKVSWIERTSHEEVLKIMDIERELLVNACERAKETRFVKHVIYEKKIDGEPEFNRNPRK